MKVFRFDNGDLLVPARAETEGLLGDGLVRLSKDSDLWVRWENWLNKTQAPIEDAEKYLDSEQEGIPLKKYDYSELEIGPAKFYVQYALSPFEIQRGLSFRESLEPNQGMLFVFSRSGPKTFHTLNMLFPLDMICVDENPDGLNVITHIEKGVEPDKLMVHLPSCKYVLEIDAGESDKWGLTVGDRVKGIKEYNTDIQKLQPPREGLVPKSGDWEYPDRWVLPEKGEQDKTAKAKHLVVLFNTEVAPNIKTPGEMGGAISKLFREIVDLGFTLEQAGEIIDPKGAEAIKEARKREAEKEKEKAAWHTLSLDDLLEKKEEELVQRAENWGKQVYGDWERGLIQGQIDGLEEYLNRGYKDINKALRQGQVPWQVRALDAALAKAVVREPITVYRGITDQSLGDVLPGGEFTDKAFVSTSLLPQVAIRAGELEGKATPVLYEISLPKGIHAAFVSGLLPEAKEAEILIQRGQRFRVMGVNKKRLVDEDRETTREYVVVSVEAIT